MKYAPALIELLAPDEVALEATLDDRALLVQDQLKQALLAIGGKQAEALRVLLGLSVGTLGTTIEHRRQLAGELLRLLPDTFRRDRHEGQLLRDLAMELYQLSITRSGGSNHMSP